MDFLQEASKEVASCFFHNFIRGELVSQAERKVRPSTHIPDLDNANVGTCDHYGKLPNRRFPVFSCKEVQSW